MMDIEEVASHMGELFEMRQDISEQSIYNKIMLSAIMFAQQTSLIRREFEIELQDCINEYLIENCHDVDILYIEKLEAEDVDGKPLCNKFFIDGDFCKQSIYSNCSTGCSGSSVGGAVQCQFIVPSDANFVLKIPSHAGLSGSRLTITASVAPKIDAIELDDEFVTKHRLPVLYGALALVAEVGFDSKYSSFATKYRMLFQNEILRHSIRSGLNHNKMGARLVTKRLV